MEYLHFTDIEGARNIVSSEFLKKAGEPFPDAVFAVAVGGAYVPSVQQTKMGRAKNRLVAILFTTEHLPDKAFPEEVLWHMDKLPISIKKILPAKKAANIYLDDSLPMDEDDILQIPMHPIYLDDNDHWVRK